MSGRDCSTCAHDESMSWLSSTASRKECRVETRNNSNLGYPSIGDKCRSYSRVPGSDDDYERRNG